MRNEEITRNKTGGKKQIPLRIGESLYAELERWAEDDFRSVNGQIEYLLTECVRYRRRGKKGLTPPLFHDVDENGNIINPEEK